MEIKKYKPSDHKIKALVYGKPGSGKTTFVATAPKPIFASAEGGLLSIAHLEPDAVHVKSLKDLMDLHDYLLKEKHEYQTVIIDSITEINEVIKSEIEKKTGRSIQKNDWVEVQNKIKKVIRSFRDLPMHVLFLALENVEKDEERIVNVTPSLNGKSATDIAAFMDIVGYLYIEKTTGERKITIASSTNLLTKDRSNTIPVENTPLDFSARVMLVQGILTGESISVATHESGRKDEESTKPLPVITMDIVDKACQKIVTGERTYNTVEDFFAAMSTKFVVPTDREQSITQKYDAAMVASKTYKKEQKLREEGKSEGEIIDELMESPKV